MSRFRRILTFGNTYLTREFLVKNFRSHPVMFKESVFFEKVSREHEGSVSLGFYSALSADCTQTQTAERGSE